MTRAVSAVGVCELCKADALVEVLGLPAHLVHPHGVDVAAGAQNRLPAAPCGVKAGVNGRCKFFGDIPRAGDGVAVVGERGMRVLAFQHIHAVVDILPVVAGDEEIPARVRLAEVLGREIVNLGRPEVKRPLVPRLGLEGDDALLLLNLRRVGGAPQRNAASGGAAEVKLSLKREHPWVCPLADWVVKGYGFHKYSLFFRVTLPKSAAAPLHRQSSRRRRAPRCAARPAHPRHRTCRLRCSHMPRGSGRQSPS